MSADVRVGWVAAVSMATCAPSSAPQSAGRSAPAASRTASASPTHCSSDGGTEGSIGSDSPTPRRSIRINRLNDARLRWNRANPGSSSIESIEIVPEDR